MRHVASVVYSRRFAFGAAIALLAALFCSCARPKVSTRSQVGLDEEPISGGISSSDVRTIATRMTPAILAVPEVAGSDDPARIAIAPMRNSSRFVIDTNLFMRRLRMELNRHSGGKVRFFSQNRAQDTRKAVLAEKNEARLETAMQALGKEISELPIFRDAATTPKVAVIPVLNSNFVNMNADSVMAVLRSDVARHAAGRLDFLMPGAIENADYFLTGQFIADSLKREAIVDLAAYIEIVEDRLKAGKSLSVYDNDSGVDASGNEGNQVIVSTGSGTPSSILERIAANSQLRTPPNVTKRLNIMLVKADTKVSVYEKMFTIEEKHTEGLGEADLVLSGEITGLSKRIQGAASDYLLIAMQLVDPETNELVWEDGYEIQKRSDAGIVYQ